MELPIKFPSEAEVIREEVARFRALSPDEQVRVLDDMFRFRQFMLKNAQHPEFAKQFDEDEERRGREAIQEFVARHG